MDGMITTDRRIVSKPTIDANGNWITVPHVVWRDALGRMHDRPATVVLPFPIQNQTAKKEN